VRRLWCRVSGYTVRQEGGVSAGRLTGGSPGGCPSAPSEYVPIRAGQTRYVSMTVSEPGILNKQSQVTVNLDICDWDELAQRGREPTALTHTDAVQAIIDKGTSLLQKRATSQ